jgi:hypothetical protein
MPLKNDWANGDLFTPAAANDMADAVNSSTSRVFDAREYGVVADGAQHNNVANLLDCVAACVAAGGGTVLLPPGTIVTAGTNLGTVTADSGNTYTNNGGIPLPVDTPITIEGHGVGNTVIQLSPGLPRAFDFWYTAAGEVYRDITIRRLTVDRNNLTGIAIAPYTATTGAATISTGVWTTIPGLSATTFRNARVVWCKSTNAGTAKDIALKCRISGSNVQFSTDGATSYTLNSGDQVSGCLRDNVIVGTRQFAGSVPGGWDTTIDGLTVEDVESINVSTETAATLGSAKSDQSVNILISVSNQAQTTAKVVNCVVRNVRMYGGESGAVLEGRDGTFVDRCFFVDSFHDTMVNPTTNYVSANFMFGQNAWVGTVGLLRCHGRRSGDVAVEIDQPWLAYEVDCLWEDSYSGVYNTTFVPPARTAAGPPTTTLGTNISASWDGSSAITPTFGALPADVSRSGIVKIDSELFWYTATNDAGTAVSLMRALNGTTVAAHTSGATVTFVETAKTRIHSIRSTTRNSSVLTATSGGQALCSFDNAGLPLPPWSIQDATVDMIGGSIAKAGQCFLQFGWRPDLDIQGLKYTQVGMTGSGSVSNVFGSAMQFFWTAGSNIRTLYPIPAPRLFGRNNFFHIQGLSSSNFDYYTTFRAYSGYSQLDFDLSTEIALRNAASGRVAAMILDGEGAAKYNLAPGSRVGLKNRSIAGVGTDAFSVGLTLGDSTTLPIVDMLDVDIDSSGMAFSAAAGDQWYRPWKISATNVDKVRFGKVIHSSSVTSAYPQTKVPTRLVTANHTVTAGDSVIQVDTTSSAVTVTLPRLTGGDTSLGGQPLARGQQITIVDVGFNSAVNAITVTPNAADKIDNGTAGTSVTIATAGSSLTLVAYPEQPGWVTVKGSSANKLTTARTINGVSFDGTANITVADSTKEPTITAGTSAQYYRGDKTFQTLNADAVPDGVTNKAFTDTDKTKLSGIATSATANSADATLLARANHTGSQTASTISDFNTVADARVVAGVTPKTVGVNWVPSNYVSGNYYGIGFATGITTTASSGNGNLRLSQWVVTDSITVTRLAMSFTVAGDANSVYRIGIFNHDAATGKPSTLVLDAGTISTGTGNAGTVATGGTPGIYELTVSQALTPGWYWVGAVIQGVSVTQPTVSIQNGIPFFGPLGTSPIVSQPNHAAVTGVTGALGNLSAGSVSFSGSTACPRITFKVS